jgi:hypothetical protein
MGCVLNTDDAAFDGFGAVATGQAWSAAADAAGGSHIDVYVPARSAIVMKPLAR